MERGMIVQKCLKYDHVPPQTADCFQISQYVTDALCHRTAGYEHLVLRADDGGRAATAPHELGRSGAVPLFRRRSSTRTRGLPDPGLALHSTGLSAVKRIRCRLHMVSWAS